MPVTGLFSVRVANDDQVAVTAFRAGKYNGSFGGGVYPRAFGNGDVQAGVKLNDLVDRVKAVAKTG